MLSDKQLNNVCLQYAGAGTCRYLESAGYKSANCLKQTCHKQAIDQKVKEQVDKLKKNGQDPALLGMPLGDGNGCQGYPYLKYIRQGYDVKS